MKKRSGSYAYWLLCTVTMLFLMLTLLNIRTETIWELLWYDIRSSFVDNPEYFKQMICVIGFIAVLLCYCILSIKGQINLQWTVRVGRHKFIYSGCQWLKKVNKIVIAVNVVCFLGCFGWMVRDIYSSSAENSWKGSKIVGHAFGAVDGKAYTNSLEAFLSNYDAGYRSMEVDMEITSDNKVVLRHDWDWECQEGISAGERVTEEQFLSVPILGMYTPLSFADLCLLMEEYSDVWIITDTKYAKKEEIENQFNVMVETAKALGLESVLDRLIVQIYNEEMLETVKNIYPVKSFIFTLYQRWNQSEEEFVYLSRWCIKNNVDAITMGKELYSTVNEIAKRYSIDMYVHTENDITAAKEYFELGARGIYTDMIREEMEVEE